MIATLSQTSIEEIHEAFIDAFSDYEVRMDLPLAKLQEMMITRSCSKADSLGYFENGKLLGFLLVGKRIIDGRIVLYDVATGVVKGHQGEGIGDALVNGIVEAARTGIADRFILEVLENNEAAQELYAKHGFGITRCSASSVRACSNTILHWPSYPSSKPRKSWALKEIS